MNKLLLSLITIPLIICSGCLQITEAPDIDYIVTPTAVQNTAYDKSTEEFTVMVKYTGDSLIDYRKPIISFSFVPLLKEMRDKDDYAYLFFTAVNYEKQLFKDSDGVYQIRWVDEDDEIWMMSGEKRITLDETITLTLTLDLNPFQLIDLESSSMTLEFSNLGNTWNKSYNVKFVGVEI